MLFKGKPKTADCHYQSDCISYRKLLTKSGINGGEDIFFSQKRRDKGIYVCLKLIDSTTLLNSMFTIKLYLITDI